MQHFYQFQNPILKEHCHHLISQKDMAAPYQCSLALHTQENPDDILQNRQALKHKFPAYSFIGAYQTHSDNIQIIKKNETLGWDSLDDAIQDCDALISNQPKVMLSILTADCVPILLFDPIKKVIAAVHAGWKGTQSKILLKTVQRMKEAFFCHESDLIVGIGPSIGKCCYEVDWNVAQHFSDIPNSYTQNNEKYKLDLPFINQQQLLKAGVKADNIELSGVCTACENERYFSYRKEGGCSGRFITIIGLK